MNRTKKNITEHGLSMYRQRGCRCDVCKEAIANERKRFRKYSDRKSIRLNGEIFVARLLADERHGAIDSTMISKWRRFGIDIYNADEWCVKLGYHPSEIWGQDFYQQCGDDELMDA